MPARRVQLPMFPLSTVLFPHGSLTLHVFEERYRVLVADCLAGDDRFGVVLIARGSEVGGGDQRTDVGTVAVVRGARPLPDGRWLLAAEGEGRLRVRRWLGDDPYPRAEVERWPGEEATEGEPLRRAESAVRRVRALLSELGEAAAPPAEDTGDVAPDVLAWRLCDLAPLTPLDRQRLLATVSGGERLVRLHELMTEVGDDLGRLLSGG